MTFQSNLARIEAELAKATADHELIERLRGARERMERLRSERDAEQARISAARIEAATKAKADRLGKISNVSIVDTSTGKGGGLLHESYRVTFTKPTYDFRTDTSRPQQHIINGFRALPPDVLEYLIEVEPAVIPQGIRNLAPGKPRAAFDEYFASLRRGYIVGKSAQ